VPFVTWSPISRWNLRSHFKSTLLSTVSLTPLSGFQRPAKKTLARFLHIKSFNRETGWRPPTIARRLTPNIWFQNRSALASRPRDAPGGSSPERLRRTPTFPGDPMTPGAFAPGAVRIVEISP